MPDSIEKLEERVESIEKLMKTFEKLVIYGKVIGGLLIALTAWHGYDLLFEIPKIAAQEVEKNIRERINTVVFMSEIELSNKHQVIYTGTVTIDDNWKEHTEPNRIKIPLNKEHLNGLTYPVHLDLSNVTDIKIFLSLRGIGYHWQAQSITAYPLDIGKEPDKLWNEGFVAFIHPGFLFLMNEDSKLLSIAKTHKWQFDWMVVGIKSEDS